MHVKQPHSKAKAIAAGIFCSLFIMSCNDEGSGNMSTEPSREQADTVNNATNTTNSAINNDTSGSGGAVSDTATRTGVSVTDTSAGNRSKQTKKKPKVSASLGKDDPNARIEMDKQGYYSRTEVLPAYSGGESALETYIINNIEYPDDAINNSVEGVVHVQFAVDETGKVSNVRTIGQKLGYGLEEQAVKVVSNMPKWKPGKVKGKNVKSWRTLPINYQLES